MLKRVRKFLVVGLISGLIIIKAGVSSGLPMVEITYNITETVSGIWTYNYTLENVGVESIWLWDISLAGGVFDITKPVGWDFFTDYTSWIEWSSLSSEISAGEVLAGFSYKSSGAPGWVRYEVESTIIIGDPTSGLTRGATPEPSALLLLGSGILVGVRSWRKRNLVRS